MNLGKVRDDTPVVGAEPLRELGDDKVLAAVAATDGCFFVRDNQQVPAGMPAAARPPLVDGLKRQGAAPVSVRALTNADSATPPVAQAVRLRRGERRPEKPDIVPATLVPLRPANVPIALPQDADERTIVPQSIMPYLAKWKRGEPLTTQERRSFWHFASRLRAEDCEKATFKAHLFAILSDVYVQLATEPALQEAIRCLDQAMLALAPHRAQFSRANLVLLSECQERRGWASAMLAKRIAAVVGSAQGGRIARLHRDAAYRDYRASVDLVETTQAHIVGNYVAIVARHKTNIGTDARHAIERACAVEPDFADGHFVLFWQTAATLTAQKSFQGERQGLARELERCLQALHAAEMAALYHYHLDQGPEPVLRERARLAMGDATAKRAVDIRLALSQSYAQMGGEAAAGEERCAALLHLCHAEKGLNWLLQQHVSAAATCGALSGPLGAPPSLPQGAKTSRERNKLLQQIVSLRARKAALYGQLGLHRCRRTELQAALDLAEQHGWQAKAAPLRRLLGETCWHLGDNEAARTHLTHAAQSRHARGALVRKSLARLKVIERGAASAAFGARNSAAEPVPAALQEIDLDAECLQVLADNERACGKTQGVVWQSFVAELAAAPTVQAWCEVVLANVALDHAVTPARLQRLLTVADSAPSDGATLADLQSCIAGALDHFQATKLAEQDRWHVRHQAAQARLRASDAFVAETQRIAQALRVGDTLRPGQDTRRAVEELAHALARPAADSLTNVLPLLTGCFGELHSDAHAFLAAHPEDALAELRRVVDGALVVDALVEVACSPNQIPGGDAVVVTGRTLYWSLVRNRVDAALAADDNRREVRLVAEVVYMDADVTLPGINLTVGGGYVEWMLGRRADGSFGPITVNLAGQDGADAAPLALAKAASGGDFGAAGQDGMRGNDGDGGRPGGSLLIHATETCVGLTSERIAAILLGGGRGGAGSNGQEGGDGHVGKPGRSADATWNARNQDGGGQDFLGLGMSRGYVHFYPGEAGGAAGKAGLGGAVGLGGEGGRAGQLRLQGAAANAMAAGVQALVVKTEPGACGRDGQAGLGGKGALGGADGLDRVLLKRNFFRRHKRRTGLGLKCTGRDPRREESWTESWPSPEATALRGASQDLQGQHQTRHAATRRHATLASLDGDALARQVTHHLGQGAAEADRNATVSFATERGAAREAAALLAASGAELNAVLDEARAVKEETAAQLAQSQAQATRQHQRGQAGGRATQLAARRVRIVHDGDPSPCDPAAPLDLTASPVPHPLGETLVVHPVEIAMDAVNAADGASAAALGELLHQLNTYLVQAHAEAGPARGLAGRLRDAAGLLPKFGGLVRTGAQLAKPTQAQALLSRLAELVDAAPLVHLAANFEELRGGLCALQAAVKLWPALKPSYLRLQSAVVRKGHRIDAAQRLAAEVRGVAEDKRILIARTLRVEGAIRRALAADRLLYRVLAADAGVPNRQLKNGSEPAWLETRLSQKVARVLAASGVAEAKRGPYQRLATERLAAVRTKARQAKAVDFEGVKAIGRQFTRQLADKVAAGKMELARQTRQLDDCLTRACVRLAEQGRRLPTDLAAKDLAEVVAYLASVDVPPKAALPKATATATAVYLERPATDLVALLRNQILADLTAWAATPRTYHHLERQLEQLRPAVAQAGDLFVTRVRYLFDTAYTYSSPAWEQDSAPFAGEVALALLQCSTHQLGALRAALCGQSTSTGKDAALEILWQILQGEGPAAMVDRLEGAAWAGQGGDEAATLERARTVCLTLLTERHALEQAHVLAALARRMDLASKLGPTEAQAGELPPTCEDEQDRAPHAWLPLARSCFAYRALVPNADLLAAATATLSNHAEDLEETDICAAIALAAIPAELQRPLCPARPDQLLACLAKELDDPRHKELSTCARAAVFLLLMGELERRHTATALALVERCALRTPESGPIRTALGLAEAALSARLFDADLDLLQAWQEAAVLVRHKLALANGHEALRGAVPTAKIARTMAQIEGGCPQLPEHLRAEVLQEATAAARGKITTLLTELWPVAYKVEAHVGRLLPEDGWDPALSEGYNTGLQVNAPKEGRAQLFLQLLARRAEASADVSVHRADAAAPPAEPSKAHRAALALAVGLANLPFAPAQELTLYGNLTTLAASLPGAQACRLTLQERWAARINAVAAQAAADEAEAEQQLASAQQAFSRAVADLFADLKLPQSSFHMAASGLFVAMLDRHYGAANADSDGARRRLAYQEVLRQAAVLFADATTPAGAGKDYTALLHRQLGDALNYDPAKLATSFTEVVQEITSPDGALLSEGAVERAMARLEARFWQGSLPFYAEGTDAALTLLEDHVARVAPALAAAESPLGVDKGYAALVQLLKRKFLPQLVADDAFAVREAVRQHVAERRRVRQQAFAEAIQWVVAPDRTADQLAALPELEASLQQLCKDPSHPLPVLDRSPVSPHATSFLSIERDLDTWLAVALEHAATLPRQAIREQLVPACQAYLASCRDAVKSADAQDATKPLHHADAVRLATLDKLLQALLARPANEAVDASLKQVLQTNRTTVAELQLALMGMDDAAAKRRERAIFQVVLGGLVAWPDTDPAKTNLHKILSWGSANKADVRAFLAAHQDSDRCADRLQTVLELASAVRAAAACLGDATFVDLAAAMDQRLVNAQQLATPLATTQLWLALPQTTSPAAAVWDLAQTFPENWATKLRRAQCSQAMQKALAVALGAVAGEAPGTLQAEEVDSFCARAIEDEAAAYNQAIHAWEAVLDTLQTTDRLRPDQRAEILALLARKLEPFAAGRAQLVRQDFADFCHDLVEPEVLALLGRELDRPHSALVVDLQDPLLATSKHALLQAWIAARLEKNLEDLPPAEKNRLVALLLDLASLQQAAAMRKVVEALRAGGPITPAAVDVVGKLVDQSFALDATSLALLSGRSKNATWAADIAAHAKPEKSALRPLSALIDAMAAESSGVNRAVAAWLQKMPGQHSPLQLAVEAIRTALANPSATMDAPIATWDAAAIRAWSEHRTIKAGNVWHYSHRGAWMDKDPAHLQVALAVVCRAIYLTKGYWPRDNQLAAMWLLACGGTKVGRPGRLAQVATGEGKSVITAGLAILKALQGLQVDVVTSSRVLAERDAAEHKKLYAMFGLRVSNNCDEACEVGEGGRSPQQVRQGRYFSDSRPVDIVYGEVSGFERDQLLTRFGEDQGDAQVVHPSRQDKAKRCALVDEVDSLLLDNASTVLYLSHEVRSLRQLEQLFVHLWSSVNRIPLSPEAGDAEGLVDEICLEVRQHIAAGTLKLATYEVPGASYMQVQQLVDRRLRGWVRSALLARSLRLNHEYIVVGGKNPDVVVVDTGTGVEQNSVRWSYGLHQFLQLKHGLEVGTESLKALFLANFFFFAEYGQKIYGLSGTLGSEAEQKCLTDLYGVEVFKVPRAHGQRYVQKQPIVVAEAKAWFDAIEAEVHTQRNQGRATLVVAASIEDVMLLKTRLASAFPELHSYSSAQDKLPFLDHERPRLVRPGDLIVATNLAGRGTDLKTSPELEEAGGLHVILAHLPTNVRIQAQAFGRTSRGKNQGSGQFILCENSRRPLHELLRLRDLAEAQRLERAVQRDVKRIAFEHDLLTGFSHQGEALPGFATILSQASARLQLMGQPDYYVTAQLDGLKNRWASWLDAVSTKLDLVHIVGRDAVVAGYKDFARGVKADLERGWQGLVVEPDEWMRLGGFYRRDERWSEAERCYVLAQKDSSNAVAAYYEASCRLISAPTADPAVKKAFHSGAKRAALAIAEKLQALQGSAQQVGQLAERNRRSGERDFGAPYSVRIQEQLQIWQIFLSSIHKALGEEIDLTGLSKSNYIRDPAHAQRVLDRLVEANQAKPLRVSQKFALNDQTFTQAGAPIPGLVRYAPAVPRLAEVLRGGAPITQTKLQEACAGLMTQASARDYLAAGGSVTPRLWLAVLPELWPGWDKTNIPVEAQPLLRERYLHLRKVLAGDQTRESFLALLLSDGEAAKLATPAQLHAWLEAMTDGGLVAEDYWFASPAPQGKKPRPYPSHADARAALRARCCGLPSALAEALVATLIEPEPTDWDATEPALALPAKVRYRLASGVLGSDLPLFPTTEAAARLLWDTLEQHGVLKPPRLAPPTSSNVAAQKKAIKATLRRDCDLDPKRLDEAVDSVFAVLEPTLGMLRELDDKKVTVQFAAIARAYFADHGQTVPPALKAFVEAGLDVVASLIEKKDPPAWYELTALIALGMAQVVAGTLVKVSVPMVGEFVGNTLLNTGIDDVTFGVMSAIQREFSWNAYWSAKQHSLLGAVKSAAIVSAASFVGTASRHGLAGAWRHQQFSQANKLHKMAKVNHTSVNLATQVAKDVGRSIANTAISQVASRGVQGVVSVLTRTYANDLERRVRRAVEGRWPVVVRQMKDLEAKLPNSASVQAALDDSLREVLARAGKEQVFTSVVRTSKPALSVAAAGVANSGWSSVVAAAGDLANLGVAVARLANLVEVQVDSFARTLRDTADRKVGATSNEQAQVTPSTAQALEQRTQTALIAGLVAIVEQTLQSSVYSPLVAMGTQQATNKVVASLLASSETERLASSSDALAEVLACEDDPSQAHYDATLRRWRGADHPLDVESLSADEKLALQDRSVEGTGKTFGQLQEDYKTTAAFFTDAQGRLYVQQPQLAAYADGVATNKPAGDVECIALASDFGQAIQLQDRKTGAVKTFHPDGRIDNSPCEGAVKLFVVPGEQGGLGHVMPSGAASQQAGRKADCLYDAFLQETKRSSDVGALRQRVAEHLRTSETCRLFYHNWSLSGEVKTFVGNPAVLGAMAWRAGAGCLTAGGIEVLQVKGDSLTTQDAINIGAACLIGGAGAALPLGPGALFGLGIAGTRSQILGEDPFAAVQDEAWQQMVGFGVGRLLALPAVLGAASRQARLLPNPLGRQLRPPFGQPPWLPWGPRPPAGPRPTGRLPQDVKIVFNWAGVAPHNGFFRAESRLASLLPGTMVDRYGLGSNSKFLAPAGTPFSHRGLPPHYRDYGLHAFEVKIPFLVETGYTAPILGTEGMGVQHLTQIPVLELEIIGYLKRVK